MGRMHEEAAGHLGCLSARSRPRAGASAGPSAGAAAESPGCGGGALPVLPAGASRAARPKPQKLPVMPTSARRSPSF